MDGHFFQLAPSVGWLQMLWRSIQRTPTPPALLAAPSQILIQPHSPTGKPPQSASPEKAAEYSTFLINWFYGPQDPVTLCPPPQLFQKSLGKDLLGIELRTPQQALVGVVFCWRAGSLLGKPTGLITWLCVHPSWRKRGVTNVLLRAMWKAAQPCPSFWFRNDGWLKSSLPPIHFESRIVRKCRGQQGYSLKKVAVQPLLSTLMTTWSQTHPSGLLLEPSGPPPLLEAWQLSHHQKPVMTLFLQPTFEVQRHTHQPWCEVLVWLAHTELPAFSEQMYIEAICDGLPYTWIDAPSSMPHVDSLWLSGGYSMWSAVGFDSGTPFQRPVLAIQAA